MRSTSSSGTGSNSSLDWHEVPVGERLRLQRNEKRQRYKTRQMGLPAQPVSIEALWLAQNGMCVCNECRGHVPLEVGDTVIAHEYFRAGKNSPGHVPANVSLWRASCNSREAIKEKAAVSKSHRMGVRGHHGENKAFNQHHSRPDPWNRRFKRKLNGQVIKR